MPLCGYCSNIDAREILRQLVTAGDRTENPSLVFGDAINHHETIEEWVDCGFSNSGCELCKLFLHQWATKARLGDHRHHYKREIPPGEDDEGVIRILMSDPVGKLHLRPYQTRLRENNEHQGSPEHSGLQLRGIITGLRTRGRKTSRVNYLGNPSFFFKRGRTEFESADHTPADTASGNVPKDDSSITDPISLGEIYKRPGSAAALKLAFHWLQTCINEHALCRELVSKDNRLPTRVVYVGNKGDEPRLVIPADRTGESTGRETAKYLALSYCWGKDVTFKLTKENLDSFQECMPLSHWPKTLHHAVIVARGLGIPYLWVDALCIIQDDAEDWKLEAARMHDIYNHATVTLFATTSTSISDGFLQTENRRVSPECSLPWSIPSLGQSGKASHDKVYLRIHDGDAHEEDDRFRTEGRWRRRGWTLQERLSAARGLSYTHLQMSWHCHSATIRENNGYVDHTKQTAFDLLEESRLDQHYDTLDWLTALWNGPVRVDNHERWGVSMQEYHTFLIRYWYRLTNEFQWRSFTYEADKLASVAGLANVLEQKTAGRDRYWAGLWESDWTLGLLWIAWGNKRSREEIDRDLQDFQLQPDDGITKPHAPSWSWASALAHDFSHWGAEPTDFSSHRRDMHSFLRNVETPRFTKKQERFIPTEPLVLRITAPIQRLSDNWRDVPSNPQPDVFRSAFERDLRSLFHMTTDEGIEHRSGHFRAEFAQKHQGYHRQHFVAIQIANWIQSYQASVDLPQPASTSQNSNDAWVVFFLILESVPEHTNRYRRVGALALPEVYPFGKQELLEDEIPTLQMMREEGPWPEREIELV